MSQQKISRRSIEFNLTEHCNLRCEHCDHASSIMPQKFADLGSFTRDIHALAAVMHADEFKFLGGEPLLHPQLLEFIRAARNANIADRMILVTNGVLLHKAPEELWELIDGMWISAYPGIKHHFDRGWLQNISNISGIPIWWKEMQEFEQSALIEETKDGAFVQMVYENCDKAHLYSCHTIYEGRYYICSPSVWMEPRLSLHGIKFENRDADSVQIHDNPSLYSDLYELTHRKSALEACRYCLGGWARPTPNKQLNRKSLQDFLSRNPEPLANLISPERIVPLSLAGKG